MSARVNPDQARTAEYQQQLIRDAAENICPLCYDVIVARGVQMIEFETSDWYCMESSQPYPDQLGRPPLHHVIIAPKRCLKSEEKMSTSDVMQLWEMRQCCVKHLGMEYGLFFNRFGGEGVNHLAGRTVAHIHFHMLRPFNGAEAATIAATGKFLKPGEIDALKKP